MDSLSGSEASLAAHRPLRGASGHGFPPSNQRPWRRRGTTARMARQLRIEVTFLGSLQQVAGRGTVWLELPQQPTVARVLALLKERMPQFVGVEMVVNVNGVAPRAGQEIRPGDSLFLLPPD